MEIITFLIGIFIGITMNKLMRFIKILLCFGTTFIMLKIIHPKIFLLPIKEWTWINLFYGNNYYFGFVVFMLISWLIFYWIIPYLTMKLVSDKLKIKFTKMLSNKKDYIVFEKIINKLAKKTISFYKKISWDKTKIDTELEINIDDLNKSLITSFALLIHLTICIIYFLNEYRYSALILLSFCLIIVIYHIVFLPAFNRFMGIINKIINIEFKE
jgi:hypothetical protein